MFFFTIIDCFENGKGRKATAADFEFSFKRLIDPTTAARGNWGISKYC
jgi:ABC-type oligopeptide transport system substrate-binding subunit